MSGRIQTHVRRAVTAFALAILLLPQTGRGQALTQEVLSMYNPANGLYFWELPTPYNYKSPYTSHDTVSNITGFGERFTSPFYSTYLDSISVGLEIDRLDNIAGNAVQIEARPELSFNGSLLTSFASSAFASASILPGQIKDSVADVYTFNMHHASVDSEFFVTVRLTDTNHADVFVMGDSLNYGAGRAIIQDSDRARLYLTPPAQAYLADWVWGDEPTRHWYPNFLIIAYVSTPSGGVAELYPANPDPLGYFVERSPSGEITLHFTLEQPADVLVTMYDESGRVVNIMPVGYLRDGPGELALNRTGLPSGRYYCRVQAGDVSEVRPVVLLH